MVGTNVSQMLMFMQETMQVQKATLMKGNSTAKSAEKSDFGEFMQESTANVNNKKTPEAPVTEAPSEETVEQKGETTDDVKENVVTAKSNKKEPTVTSDTIKRDEMEEETGKNTFYVADVFKSKVEQVVTGSLKPQEGVISDFLEVSENRADLPKEFEDTEIVKNPEVVVTPENVQAQAVPIVVTGNDVSQQDESSEEEKQQILDLGNLEIKFQFSDKKKIAIMYPTEILMENQTESADKVTIGVQLPNELKDVLEEVQSQLVQKIMEHFQVTEEEVAEAMEVLAIQFYDLANSDKLKELAVCLSGEENLVSILTNEQLFTAYKEVEAGIEKIVVTLPKDLAGVFEELSEKVPQLQEDLSTIQMPMEEVGTETVEHIGTKTDWMSSSNVETVLSEQKQQDTIPVEVVKADETAKSVEMDKTVEMVKAEETVNITLNGENVEEQPKQEMLKQQETVTTKTNGVSMETKGVWQEANSNSQNSFQGSTQNDRKQGNTAKAEETSVVQNSTTFSTVVTETEVQTVVKTQQTDFYGIVRQIVEQVKVQVRPDTVSMQLQLNPENLGKVNLYVSSKEGVVTAQLLVQNETVKTAIEGQLTVLREAMQQQGIKVEAVEVAVETGEFGRNLEQQSQQGRQEERRQQAHGDRKVHLLASMEEESISEDELLKAHIMRESGNSVDMNA